MLPVTLFSRSSSSISMFSLSMAMSSAVLASQSEISIVMLTNHSSPAQRVHAVDVDGAIVPAVLQHPEHDTVMEGAVREDRTDQTENIIIASD